MARSGSMAVLVHGGVYAGRVLFVGVVLGLEIGVGVIEGVFLGIGFFMYVSFDV